MKRSIMAVTLAAGVLLFAGTAWADEPNKHDHSGTQVQQTAAPTAAATTAPTVAPTAAGSSAHDHNMTQEEHQNMDTTGTGGSSAADTHSTHGTAEESSSSAGDHSHGSGEPLVETPANKAVLGTFGGIMGAFILYGAVTKLLRKKEGAHA